MLGAIVLPQIAVELVRPALDLDLRLATTRPAVCRTEASYRAAEFLNRVYRRIADSAESLTCRLIVGVDTVDRNIALIGS